MPSGPRLPNFIFTDTPSLTPLLSKRESQGFPVHMEKEKARMSAGNPSLRGGFLAGLKPLHSPSFNRLFSKPFSAPSLSQTHSSGLNTRPTIMHGFWFVGWGLGKG